MTHFFNHLLHCTNFKGKLSRKTFWRFMAVHIAISLLIGLATLITLLYGNYMLEAIEQAFIGYLIFALLTSLSAIVRRLNDARQSPWKILLLLIPIYGHALLLVDLCKSSRAASIQISSNKHY